MRPLEELVDAANERAHLAMAEQGGSPTSVVYIPPIHNPAPKRKRRVATSPTKPVTPPQAKTPKMTPTQEVKSRQNNREICYCGCGIKFKHQTKAQGDHSRCHFCNKPFTQSGKHIRTREHIVPRVKGGSHHQVNLVWTCLDCNNKKGEQFPHDHNGCEICGMAILAHDMWRENGKVPSLMEARRILLEQRTPAPQPVIVEKIVEKIVTVVAQPIANMSRTDALTAKRIRALKIDNPDPYRAARPYDELLGVKCVCRIGVQACEIHPYRLKTKDERIAFGKDFDRRYQEGITQAAEREREALRRREAQEADERAAKLQLQREAAREDVLALRRNLEDLAAQRNEAAMTLYSRHADYLRRYGSIGL